MGPYIVLDVGGTFLKAALADVDRGGLHGVRRRDGATLQQTSFGPWCLNPAELMSEVRTTVQELSSEAIEISGILVTGQMHGWVITDEDLHPLTDVVTWRDDLAAIVNGVEAPAVEQLRQKLSKTVLSSLGNELRTGLPLSSLYARKTRGMLPEYGVVHSLISFVAHGLVGSLDTHIMHATDAAAHGLMNVAESTWATEALDTFQTKNLRLPEISRDVIQIGEDALLGCPVYTAIGDQQASLLGVQLGPRQVSLNIATGSQVSVVSEKPLDSFQCRPYFAGTYLSTVTHIPAGRALNCLVSLVSELSEDSNDAVWQNISEMVNECKESDLEIDLSFFDSATGSRGFISNICETNLSIGNIFRAAIEKMADTYHSFVQQIVDQDEYDEIVLSGGLNTRFTPLRESIALKFPHKRIVDFKGEDASLQGLYYLCQKINCEGEL